MLRIVLSTAWPVVWQDQLSGAQIDDVIAKMRIGCAIGTLVIQSSNSIDMNPNPEIFIRVFIKERDNSGLSQSCTSSNIIGFRISITGTDSLSMKIALEMQNSSKLKCAISISIFYPHH